MDEQQMLRNSVKCLDSSSLCHLASLKPKEVVCCFIFRKMYLAERSWLPLNQILFYIQEHVMVTLESNIVLYTGRCTLQERSMVTHESNIVANVIEINFRKRKCLIIGHSQNFHFLKLYWKQIKWVCLMGTWTLKCFSNVWTFFYNTLF